MAKVFTITEGLENLGALKTGGQGSVYKGRRIGEIITAIKLLPTPIYSEDTNDKNFLAFQNEVQKLKKVNEEASPNIVKILSSGITDSGNFPYIEMEFIEGPDLEELLQPPHDPVFTIKEILKVADHLSSALAHCHKIGLRHGDIKSNNVKYNVSTGNYVLLDFGLAVMSDEQRRTSLRHAGAVEFMAPEQSEGQTLFESDVYGFGIILFELLAGQVPFPLNDKGETARNRIMLAHLEKLPPDALTMRQNTLPEKWSKQKLSEEMQVPAWLVQVIYKCLEKKPENRFADGIALNKSIADNIHGDNKGPGKEIIGSVEKENLRLRKEKEELQQQLLHYKKLAEGSVNSIKEYPPNTGNQNSTVKITSGASPLKKASYFKISIFSIIALAFLSAVFYGLINYNRKPIGDYKISAARAYYYDKPDINTRTNLVVGQGTVGIKAFEEQNGFLLAEITDSKGSKSRGWLRKQDLITLEEWKKRNAVPNIADQQKKGIAAQLQNAKYFLSNGKNVEALIIYNSLAKQQVPEAMYEYGKLALQNINLNITCTDALNLIKKAGEKGYTPAKRTLGFLYSFASSSQLLKQNNYYQRCVFAENIERGSRLLMEATIAGDTTASRLLDDLNTRISQELKR